MSKLIKLAVALCFITCVIVDVCVAEPKARSRRSSRRCPSACLRRIRQFEKKPGPTGPPGPPGPQGYPGKQGTSLILPACKLGEYLTSDGTSLRCEKLNLEGVCNNLRRKCPSNDKDATKGNEGATTIVPGKMVKFMKKNKFQSIGTDAWDIEVFDIDGSLFFGLSQLGHASFQIYKWFTTSFKEYQTFKVMNARNWSPFKIGDDQYFVVATYLGNTCPIFRFDKSDQKFKNQSVGIECKETVDLKPFKLNDVQHIVVANHEDRQPVVIWKWNGKRFIKMQEIAITATYVEAFQVIRDTFIAISGSDTRGPHVFFYKWNGKKFVYFQRYYTGDRPYEMEAFEAGQHEFISVATFGVRNPNKMQLLKWNGAQFESFQNITSYGARRITSMSSPLMGKKTTYLAVINYFKDPEIYYWLGDISTKFEKLQEIEAKSARDVSFFEMGSNVYMLLSSRKHIDIFRGELV